MKRIIRQIGRKIMKFDISPFSRGGYIKLILYVIWGINAGVFICHDKQTENDYGSEQVRIHESRDVDNIVIADSDNINSLSLQINNLTGCVFIPDIKTLERNSFSSLSNRAPPFSI
jgi:hypothetical protein